MPRSINIVIIIIVLLTLHCRECHCTLLLVFIFVDQHTAVWIVYIDGVVPLHLRAISPMLYNRSQRAVLPTVRVPYHSGILPLILCQCITQNCEAVKYVCANVTEL